MKSNPFKANDLAMCIDPHLKWRFGYHLVKVLEVLEDYIIIEGFPNAIYNNEAFVPVTTNVAQILFDK